MAWFELLGRGVGRVVSRWRRLRGRTSGRTLLQMGVVLLGPGLGRRTGRRHRSLLELGEPPWLSLIDYGLSMRGRQALACGTVLLYKYPFHKLNKRDVEYGKAPNHDPINKKQGLGMEKLLQRWNI